MRDLRDNVIAMLIVIVISTGLIGLSYSYISGMFIVSGSMAQETIYSHLQEIKLIPSKATFRVISSSPEGIFKILLLPIEIFKKILPLKVFID